QLSRAVQQRQDKPPIITHIPQSPSIHQHPHILPFLYPHHYYNPPPNQHDHHHPPFHPQTNHQNPQIQIIIPNQPNPPTPTLNLHFIKQYNKFTHIHYPHPHMI
ncbi:DnaB-like helicase C-terminal domain-containing protein, partial [Staphylococcus aureus]|uniref:DnaB-like helicase C-terminal domain-containing protein n=1 Tax=Staphylococcus aureus TaxID=1280 RepID=UPI0028CB3EE7